MYTILLDSSNTKLGVGLSKDGVFLDSILYEAWQQQSEYMVLELKKLLDKYEVKNSDINKIVVAIGPGSYTGVRIALTIAKTISVALGVDIYSVSALRVLKSGKKPSICVINARSNRSYVGIYEDDKIILEDRILKNTEVVELINENPNYVICGNTKHLGIEGYETNTLLEMNSLEGILTKCENPLGLKPVYMKD